MARRRILLAHGDLDCQTIYTSVLTFAGYDVDTADTIDAAIELLGTGGHDAVVADLYLRSQGSAAGDDCLLRHIRRSRATAHLPTVILTAWTAEGHRDMARDLGADRFLGLPTTPRVLVAVIAELLEHPRSTTAPPSPRSDFGDRPVTNEP